MAAHAAALCKEIATEIQRLCSLRDTIASVTLLAAGLSVLFLKHGPEPETMTAVTFYIARRSAAVAPVTTRTTKLLRIVYLKDFSVRMADKRARRIASSFVHSKPSCSPELGRVARECPA